MPFSIIFFRRWPLAYVLGFIMLLMLSSGPAFAEWVEVGGSEGKRGYTVYVDPDTVRRNGNLVKMWILYDFKNIQTIAGASILSSKAQTQYDCAGERSRELAFTWFSGNMGNGGVVLSDSDEQKWEPVYPDSIGQTLWKVACAKK
jgi:hypothetical protein